MLSLVIIICDAIHPLPSSPNGLLPRLLVGKMMGFFSRWIIAQAISRQDDGDDSASHVCIEMRCVFMSEKPMISHWVAPSQQLPCVSAKGRQFT